MSIISSDCNLFSYIIKFSLNALIDRQVIQLIPKFASTLILTCTIVFSFLASHLLILDIPNLPKTLKGVISEEDYMPKKN